MNIEITDENVDRAALALHEKCGGMCGLGTEMEHWGSDEDSWKEAPEEYRVKMRGAVRRVIEALGEEEA